MPKKKKKKSPKKYLPLSYCFHATATAQLISSSQLHASTSSSSTWVQGVPERLNYRSQNNSNQENIRFPRPLWKGWPFVKVKADWFKTWCFDKASFFWSGLCKKSLSLNSFKRSGTIVWAIARERDLQSAGKES